MRPRGTPIGLQLGRTSKTVGRAFNDALSEAGGSLPVWLILSALRGQAHASQHDLARGIGIEGPTLTRHIDQLEAGGLVRRVGRPRDVDPDAHHHDNPVVRGGRAVPAGHVFDDFFVGFADMAVGVDDVSFASRVFHQCVLNAASGVLLHGLCQSVNLY